MLENECGMLVWWERHMGWVEDLIEVRAMYWLRRWAVGRVVDASRRRRHEAVARLRGPLQ